MLTDCANFRNPNYHTANDTLGSVNFQFLTGNVKATLATIASLAGIRHSSFVTSGYLSLIGIHQISTEIPGKFGLMQNYPNPFNPKTKIKFDVPAGKDNFVKIIVYDITGKEITTLVDENFSPGSYEVDFNGDNYSSGVYFYRMITGDFSDVKNMILIK